MSNKIKILFYNIDGAGVNYYRTLTPMVELEKSNPNDFHVEINNVIDFKSPETLEYLKSFDIIHYHRELHPNINDMVTLANELKLAGVTLVMDIDDYWHLNSKHPLFSVAENKRTFEVILGNLKIADYITTTTDLFAEEIRRVTGRDNTVVLPNAVDPVAMKQFQNNWKPDPDGLVRITYMAGSTHAGDTDQLDGVINILSGDDEVRGKFKIIIAGWDAQGVKTRIDFNPEFGELLKSRRMFDKKMVKYINKSKGDIDKIPGLSTEIKNEFRGRVFITEEHELDSKESTYYQYEKILTNNHKIIKNPDYIQWLGNFDRNRKYENEGNFGRRWTEKPNAYAKVLDESDIVIAPLADNMFNRMKSNLKQVECWTRKLPIICSDMPPYNVDGKHMENCVLIPVRKNSHKDWVKYLKKLILDADLRKQLGEQLHEDFKEKYNLSNVTKKRASFYKEIKK